MNLPPQLHKLLEHALPRLEVLGAAKRVLRLFI
jgi:hypothetical protein